MARLLLMTGTITPPADAPVLARRDPVQRRRDYLAALDFYLSIGNHCIDRIVFVENSNSDVSDLRALADCRGRGKRIEFVSFWGMDHPAACGRGYGEFKLLDYALGHSELVRQLKADEPLWKVTGRYRVLNIGRMIETAPRRYGLYCDLKDHPRPWMDTRVFSCTVAGYERLLRGIYHQFREAQTGQSPEILLRQVIGDRLGRESIVPRFVCEPYVEGIRGVDNRNYARGKNLALYWLRVGARLVAPGLWI